MSCIHKEKPDQEKIAPLADIVNIASLVTLFQNNYIFVKNNLKSILK